MITKTCPASIKAVGDDPAAGEFEALVSVFGNVDAVRDRVMPGAFAKSLAAWRERGDPIPVTWSHDWSLDGFIGSADPNDVIETEAGLVVKGRLDLADPGGAKAYRLLKERLVRNFSFSYDVVGSVVAKDALELTELDLYEFGPTLVGANRETELLAIKAGAKEGRVLSAANEARLRGLRDRLSDGLAALDELLPPLDATTVPPPDEGKDGRPSEGGSEDLDLDPAALTNDPVLQEAAGLLG